MPLRLIEICAPDGRKDDIGEIARKHNALDVWHGVRNTDHRRPVRILVSLDDQQKLMDDLHQALAPEKNWRMNIYQVEATVPEPGKGREREEAHEHAGTLVRGTLTREELYDDLEDAARLDVNFILFILLSTIVCALALIEDSIAAVVGAMVIAPLLGPNLTLAFGASLGDRDLIIKSALTNFGAILLTFALSFMAGWLLPVSLDSRELLLRTEPGFQNLAFALASGAAAALSLTTGASMAFVEIMVAVALMPPAVTFGIMTGAGHFEHAYGAGLHLAANIVCVSVAAQAVFLIKGLKPRTWYMRAKSRQSVKISLVFWIIMLAVTGLLIYFHRV